MRFYPFESDDAKDAFFEGLEKIFCSGKYSNMNSCISECNQLTFKDADEIIHKIRDDYSFSYNGYKPDDLITVKFLELTNKLQENGQNNFVDRLVDITSYTLIPYFGDFGDNYAYARINEGCSVLGAIYDVIAGPLEAQLDETETKKIVEKLNKEKANLTENNTELTSKISDLMEEKNRYETEKGNLNAKVEKLTKENAGFQQSSQLIKTLEQEKGDLSDQVDKLTQNKNYLNDLCNKSNVFFSTYDLDTFDCIV